ncbi:MAG TPA: ABC transporter permease [Agriterribacter sp.]|nr:ABC transporter permease [Agriterribacter sp.]
MFQNYFKTAWRNFVRYKVYSAINIAGLAIGLAACMLIVLYVNHESGYDSFHKNAGRIYWIQTKLKIGPESVFVPYLNYSAGPMVSKRNPSVESFLRIKNAESNTIIQNPEEPSHKFSEAQFLFADSNFFSFFSFKLLQGNKEQVLRNPLSVVISQHAAQKYFGGENPVGKTVRYNNEYNLLITGIAENAPSNSSIRYDFVASLSSILSIRELSNLVKNEKNDFTTYFLVRQPGQIAKLENTLMQLAKERDGDAESTTRFVGTPLPKLHVASGPDSANLKYLKIFPFVAALVLLLALINYVSLSTARSSIRAREIGIRKVIGAGRKTIAMQFFAESALYTSISFVLGYILCFFSQPFLFRFLQLHIDSSFLYSSGVSLAFAGLFIVTIFIAGMYPSILLSTYKPVLVLSGTPRQGVGGAGMRKILTVFQFSIAVVFIICGIVIQKQMYLFKHKDTGVNRENILMIPFRTGVSKHYAAFKQDISVLPETQEFSVALHPLFKGYDMMGISPPGSDKKILIPTLDVDQQFIPMLGLKWKLPPTDPFFYRKKNSVILNESAIQKLGLGQNPVNQKVDQFEVAGVLKDFNWSSLEHKISGLLLTVTADNDGSSLWTSNGGCLFVKINPHTNIPVLIDRMKRIYEKYDPETPFDYYFMDEAFNDLYKAEERLAEILTSFTILAIVIACLGLFGLITFMAMQRQKEIGIRKTLGASVQSIVKLLSVDFIVLVLIAVIVASPVAWYFMNKWLQDFAYRVNIGWWVFAFAGSIALMIAFVTVSFQAIKAALANPVKSLRAE